MHCNVFPIAEKKKIYMAAFWYENSDSPLVGNLDEKLSNQDEVFSKDLNPDAKYITFNRTAGSEQAFIVYTSKKLANVVMSHEELLIDTKVTKANEAVAKYYFKNQKEYFGFVYSNDTRHILRVERPRSLVKTKIVGPFINAYTEEVIQVGRKVKSRFIGIPTSFMNISTTGMEFKGTGMPNVVADVDSDSDLEGFVV